MKGSVDGGLKIAKSDTFLAISPHTGPVRPNGQRNSIQRLGLGVKHLNCRYPIYTSCSRYKMNTNYTLPDPEERYDTSQRSYTITFRLQFLSELTVGMLSYKI